MNYPDSNKYLLPLKSTSGSGQPVSLAQPDTLSSHRSLPSCGAFSMQCDTLPSQCSPPSCGQPALSPPPCGRPVSSLQSNTPPSSSWDIPTYTKVLLVTDDFQIVVNELIITFLNIQWLFGSYKMSHTDNGSHSKLDTLHNVLRSQYPAIMGISDTKLADSIDSSELDISGFDLFRKDRNRHGGGVAFLSNSSLNPTFMALPSDIIQDIDFLVNYVIK